MIKTSINLLSEEEKEIALNLIGYNKNCIARLMTPHYVQTQENRTVEQVLEHIKKVGKKAETLNFIYVVDENNVLIDDLRIGELLLPSLQREFLNSWMLMFLPSMPIHPLKKPLKSLTNTTDRHCR